MALNVLSERCNDLEKYQKREAVRMMDRVKRSYIKTTEMVFDEDSFKELAKDFLWGNNEDKKAEDIETVELATKCGVKVMTMINEAKINSVNYVEYPALIKDAFNILNAQNGLIDYLYDRALFSTPGKRTGIMSALDTFVDIGKTLTSFNGARWDRTNIEEFIESEKTLDPVFKTIVDIKELDISNERNEIDAAREVLKN